MEKITKIKNNEIIKEQLLSEDNFLYYCNDSNNRVVTMTGKLNMRVEKNFLTAMETDGFLKPLLIAEQPVRQNDGSTKIQPVHYYSPFQIYIVMQLSHNVIDKDGKLQSPDSIDWQGQQKTRFISWGHGGAMSFNINNKKEQKGPTGWPSESMLCDNIYNFLRMLHTFDLTPRYSENWKPERTRYYTRQPDFQFNFNISKEYSKKLLKKFKLSAEKIETLRTIVGYTALTIDPLEKWYPFLKRLPQWRKDELKGEALLAQDLYGFCEVIADFWEVVTGSRPQELSEKIYSSILLPNDKRNENARGTDIEAIRLAASRLKTWMVNKKNLKFVNEISGSEVMPGYSQQLKQVEKQLTDYEQRYKKYGAGRSVNSNGFLHTCIKNTGTITLDELDPQAKRMVQNFMEQLKTQNAVKNEELELQQEIRFVIRLRLDDIQRDLSNLIHDMIQPLDSRRWQLDSEKQRGQQYIWWGEYMTSGEAPIDPAQVRTYYMEKFQPKKTAEFDKKINSLLDASNSLESFTKLAHLVLCANCRKNTVLLHQTHNDQRVSSEAVCDFCVKDKKRSPDNMKGGEWRCPNCNRVIYKFANGNILSARTLTKFPVVIELKYGQLEIEAHCPDCKIYIPGTIDWGWLS